MEKRVNITNCTFTGVHWSGDALDSVKVVSEALLQNAIALGKMAELFKFQSVECLLKVDAERK